MACLERILRFPLLRWLSSGQHTCSEGAVPLAALRK